MRGYIKKFSLPLRGRGTAVAVDEEKTYKKESVMNIHGFQKMTMLDFPGRVAATVFTAGCELRCPFCHNARLVTHPEEEDKIEVDETLEYFKKRKNMLDGVCLTGGEPLLQKGLADYLYNIKELGLQVKLDTNGCSPDKLLALIDKGLVDYVAMDIKNSPERYGETVGVPTLDLAPIEESKKLLLSGRVDYEFRTTVVRELHTEESLLSAARWIEGARVWYLQSFVDSGDTIGAGFSAHERDFMKMVAEKARGFVQKVELRGI